MHETAEISVRARVRVRGLVQGVGFRPFVFSLARRHELTGFVLNDDAGVLLEVQGRDLDAFLRAIREEVPPLARVDAVEVSSLVPRAESGFEIHASARSTSVTTSVVADAAPCDACLAELFDPRDRRYLYPFLNCTHCGPRFSITRRLPYDRPQTSMARFPMCAECAREYRDPTNRRFHAQPTACPACGPRLALSIEDIVRRLHAGEIVAVKGVGGYQLACDARNAATVARLRARKDRDGKPFAVMVASLASARSLMDLDDAEARALSSVTRPIVVARRRDDAGLAPNVAPDLASLGVMLPSSPLHYLLFHEAAGRPAGLDWLENSLDFALVMTSANRGGEPLITRDDEARERLSKIADAIASHDREIVIRCDDPVERVVLGAPLVLRRGRGQAPGAIALGERFPSVLAVGAHMKNAVCLTRGDEAVLSQHVGDLDDAETFRFFEETVAHLETLLETRPTAVACDLHPDFLSTRFAESLDLPCVRVQHHHAHVAAVLAEHARTGPHVGLALDGVGLGADGRAWGGELLRVDGAKMTRLGHLAELALPGGDAAAREPWRMALAVLHRLGEKHAIEERWGTRGAALAGMLDAGRTPLTSSCGRWFDAAAGLLGVCERADYEGQAPMMLESLVRSPVVLPGAWHITDGVLDLLPLFDAIRTMTPADGASAFHGTLAAALVELALPSLADTDAIVLSGGCIANAVLTRALVEGFASHGKRALLPRRAPVGDGGIALGQAWVCARTRKEA